MQDFSKRIAELSPEKRELFRRLLQHQPGAPEQRARAVLPTLLPDAASRALPFPLTDMQQAYWLGRNSAFALGNIATLVYQEFEAPDLDVARLNQAWQRLIQHHDALRLVVLPDGQQQILESVPDYRIATLDLRDHEPQRADQALDALRQRMSHQALPTHQWPLFEIRASYLPDQRVRIHFSIDALLIDGWSHQILLQQWFQLYQHPETVLPPLELSFRDYVMAEVALRETELYQTSLEYWRKRLAALPPAPDLPLAHDPSTLSNPRFVRRQHRLAPEDWQRLRARAGKVGITPTALLLTAYGQVLATWSKAQHFTLNVPRFNRLPLHPQINEIVGEFASFSLLAIDCAGEASFEERAQHVQQQLWQDLEHEHVSGVRVLRELAQLQGNSSVNMPVVFTCAPQDMHRQNAAPLSESESGIKIVYSITPTSQVWLDHEFFEVDDTLLLHWDAVEQLFPQGMLDDMFQAYCGLLGRLAEGETEWKTARHALIPTSQLAQRDHVNATTVDLPETLLQTLFTDQAAQRPEQPAVITPTGAFTYQDLYNRALQLGHELRERGVQPNTLVAIVMDKGYEQIVATLGVAMAGAAFLPIDPKVPQERLAYLLEHSAAQIAVTQPWLDQQLPWPDSVERLPLDVHMTASPREELVPAQSLDDLAYVLYTSGSTGVPKGAMIAQRGVVNAILATNERFQVGPGDRILGVTALHHDMSIYDIFGILAAGATLVLPAAEAARDPGQWLSLMQQHQVTLWNSVPAMMEMLLEYVRGRSDGLPPTLRLAFLGGDWISLTLPDRLKSMSPGTQLVSVGGPTETTLWNIWYPVTTLAPTWKSIPYGQPIANTQYYILNAALEDCPVWVPGDMYCAGVGLAQGYWHDEARTQQSFIRHPRTGARLYRTGDLGRYLPDGTIEFLGREDFQIKIQGQRIELGEIEAALAHHPQISAAVVAAVGAQRGDQRLVAYLVSQQTAGFTGADYDEYQQAGLEDRQAQRLDFKLREPGLRNVAPNTPSVALSKPVVDDTLLRAYAERRSYRKLRAAPIPLEQMSAFLACLMQVTFPNAPVPKYRYPSGGGLYPVQTYLYIKPERVAGLTGGTYYYHPRDHRLVLLSSEAHLDRSAHALDNRLIVDESAFSIFLVAQLSAIEPLYGEMSRDLCLLEAGYIGQQLMLAGPPNGIGICPLGNIEVEPIREALALEPDQLFLHVLVGGGIDPAQMTPAAFIDELALISATNAAAISGQGQARQVTGAEIQTYLRTKLPEHMVPASYVFMDALPLTTNGKIDRKALREMADAPPAPEAAYVPPLTDIERRVAAIWQEVLGIEKISVNSNFFDLGGNSLHIIQVHTKIRAAFNRDVSVTEMFKSPTISFLAKLLSQAEKETPDDRPAFQNVQNRAQRQKQALRQRPLPNKTNKPKEE